MDLVRKPLGRTGLMVSPLGLANHGGLDARDVERAFHELSINTFFVTPRMGAAVEGVRRLVKAGHRDRLVIASGAILPFGWAVPRAWNRIARALDTDHIDVFHLFWVQSRWYVSGKTWPALRRLKERGQVRALAISCHDRPMARALADELDLDALMIRYNAAHRGAEHEIFASLGQSRPGIVAYTATRWGFLLRPLGERRPLTAPECYRFCLGHPCVDTVLCAAASFDQLREDAEGVARGALDPRRLEEVRAFGDALRGTLKGRIGFGGQ